MTKEELRRIRMRFLALPILAVICAVICVLHIRSVGGTYQLPITGYDDATITVENLAVDPAGMARVTEVLEGPDGTPVATIEGIEPGNGYLFVNLPNQGGASQLRVEPGPVVIADGANFTGWRAVAISVALCFACAGLLCLWALVSLWHKSWYGYEMAVYAGGAIFCIAQACVFGWLLIAGKVTEFVDFAQAFTNLADTFVSIMLVPMAIAALFVSASNVALLRHEGRSPRNALGIAASIVFALALLALRQIDAAALASMSYTGFLVWSALDSVLAIGVCYALALFAGTSLCALVAALHVPSRPRDYLIILGCGLMPDGTVTPLLAGRVDAALRYARAQEAQAEQDGAQAGDGRAPHPKFVPSGGQGADEVNSEAEAMRRYLLTQGVEDARILPEDNSTSTRENFALSAKVIEADGGSGRPMAFATTNYHVFRGYIHAHDAGLAAEGIAAPTRLYFWPNAFLREFVGLIASRRLVTLVSYLAVAALYLVAEYAIVLSLG